MKRLKIVMVGAGSVSFCPATMKDILLSKRLCQLPLEIALMDIDETALDISFSFVQDLLACQHSDIKVTSTSNLEVALTDANYVIAAIEVDRYHYWSQDFHIPRKYGFRQVYGENGGPGGMFHFLRNVGPTLEIARCMEKVCKDAWLINYTNPEAKLVEAVSKLTSIRVVGVCHGYQMGVEQIAKILNRDASSLDVVGYGLNHFGFMTSIRDKETGKDLYPAFLANERKCHWLAQWDEIGLSRIMLRTFGFWPYPGTNHIGEYMAWSDAFLASSKIQYFFDPVTQKPWKEKETPTFVYSFSSNPTGIELNHRDPDKQENYRTAFQRALKLDRPSGEYGIPIIEAITFDLDSYIPSLNLPNRGTLPGVLEGMCVEGPCQVNARGVHAQLVEELPTAIEAMINQQGYIHRLLIEAYAEKSRHKLLQAILVDPTVASYENAVSLIDEMFEIQKDILPPLEWK